MAPSSKPHASRVRNFGLGVVRAAAACRGGMHQGRLATAGGVGNLPASQACHHNRSEGREEAMASDRRRITGPQSGQEEKDRASALWSGAALLCVGCDWLAAVPWHDLDLNFGRPDMWTKNPPMEQCSPGDLGCPDAASIVDRPSAPRSANFCGGPLDGCCNADCTVLDSTCIDGSCCLPPARPPAVQRLLLLAEDRPTASRLA